MRILTTLLLDRMGAIGVDPPLPPDLLPNFAAVRPARMRKSMLNHEYVSVAVLTILL